MLKSKLSAINVYYKMQANLCLVKKYQINKYITICKCVCVCIYICINIYINNCVQECSEFFQIYHMRKIIPNYFHWRF